MSTQFCVTAKAKPDYFLDDVSKGDAVTYSIDFTPWQEANHTITGVTWTTEAGSASISGQVLVSGVATALLTFPAAGRNLVSALATTATETKKIWLEVLARDNSLPVDDYGFSRG